MKTKYISKLYYDQYVYKLEFTDVNYTSSYFNSEIVRRYKKIEEIETVLNLYKNECKIRRENSRVYCYTNNKELISILCNILNDTASVILFQPKTEQIKSYLLSTTKKIVTNNNQYQYKVSVAPLKDMNSKFYSWAEKLPKIKLSNRSMRFGGYFYVEDSNTLTMCNLFLGGSVKRIDEIVSEDDIPAL